LRLTSIYGYEYQFHPKQKRIANVGKKIEGRWLLLKKNRCKKVYMASGNGWSLFGADVVPKNML